MVGYDGMTQRFEITCILQKELVNDAGVFGKPLKGSVNDPAVYMESVHYLLKLVAGVRIYGRHGSSIFTNRAKGPPTLGRT